MKNVKLVCGIHGVGKTVFAKKMCKKLSLKYYSASELISNIARAQIYDYKKVKNIPHNQELLLKALSEIDDNQCVLDGHLCLINNYNKIERIPYGIFQRMNIEEIYIVVDEPKKIKQRLKDRDKQIWNTDFIDLSQQEEFKYARYLAEKMNITLKIIYEDNEVIECSFLKKTNIILPIKPVFANKILSGEKKYEYRKKLCKKEIHSIYVYATAPIKMIIGEVEVISKVCIDKEDLWEQTHMHSGVSKEFYNQYFENQDYACAYKIGKVKRYGNPITLNEIMIKAVPQSYIYVEDLNLC